MGSLVFLGPLGEETPAAAAAEKIGLCRRPEAAHPGAGWGSGETDKGTAGVGCVKCC